MSEICEYELCDQTAHVALNGTWLCILHFSEALAETRKLIEKLRKLPRRDVAE